MSVTATHVKVLEYGTELILSNPLESETDRRTEFDCDRPPESARNSGLAGDSHEFTATAVTANSTLKHVRVVSQCMAYQLRCDSCEFDRECSDWAEANRYASEHEAEYGDHWVTIRDLQKA